MKRFALRLGVYITAAALFAAAFLGGRLVGRYFPGAPEGGAYWILLVLVATIGLVVSFAERELVWNRVFGERHGGLDPGPLSLGLFGGLLVGLLPLQSS